MDNPETRQIKTQSGDIHSINRKQKTKKMSTDHTGSRDGQADF